MMKVRLNDEQLDEHIKLSMEYDHSDYGINRSNLVIVELLNRLLEKN